MNEEEREKNRKKKEKDDYFLFPFSRSSSARKIFPVFRTYFSIEGIKSINSLSNSPDLTSLPQTTYANITIRRGGELLEAAGFFRETFPQPVSLNSTVGRFDRAAGLAKIN